MEVALPRGGGGIVGEARREREGRHLSLAPGAAVTGACHFSPAGAARARNGREVEIPGEYGRAGRLRLGEKNRENWRNRFGTPDFVGLLRLFRSAAIPRA